MISEKCKNTYTKLNTFVTNVINRDVTPQITNLNETTTSLQETKLTKGDWTTLSNTESYDITKAFHLLTSELNDNSGNLNVPIFKNSIIRHTNMKVE